MRSWMPRSPRARKTIAAEASAPFQAFTLPCCSPEMAIDVLEHAHGLGLDAFGVSFHVGSQQPNPEAWDIALRASAEIFRTLSERGIQLRMVNLGGGFPAKYLKKVPAVKTYGRAIFTALRKHFGNRIPETIIEPGRGMVGNAGVIKSEVVLISKKADNDNVRWVFLDIGKFGGLAETMDEAIRYPIVTAHDGSETAPCVLAGPTCDSADVMYEKTPYPLPLSLTIGDDRERLQGGLDCDFGHFIVLRTRTTRRQSAGFTEFWTKDGSRG